MPERIVVPLPGPLTVRPAHAFVGRSLEWEALRSAWEDVLRGSPRVVLIGGEAGAGKTRLASEFARVLHSAGATVLFGACDSEPALPYQPWVQAFDHLLRAAPLDPDSMKDVAEGLSALPVLLPDQDRRSLRPRRDGADPDTERFRLFTAVTTLLRDTVRRQATLLVLDDLHWAGPQTLALLRHLGRSGGADRLLVVGTFRDTGDEITDPLASCLADLHRVESTVRLRLTGLDEESIRRFVAGAVGQELDAGLRQVASDLAERTGGNAFYVGEVWRHLVATGAVARSRGGWAARVPAAGVTVPDSVREVVADRLAHLTPTGREVARLAAVAGQRVELRVLALAALRTGFELTSALDELVDAGLLAESGGTPASYQFPHAIVRDTVEASVTSHARVRFHLGIAQALEEVYEADRRPVLAELARHYTASASSGATDRAVYYSRRAAAQALRSVAYDEAISQLEGALAVVPAGFTHERAELLSDLGNVQLRHGLYETSTRTYRQAYEIARDLDEIELAAQAAIGFETAGHMPGLPGDAAAEMLAAVLHRADAADQATRARLESSLGRALAHSGRTTEGITRGERALLLAREMGDPGTLAVALQAVLVSHDDPVRILELSEELTELAERTGDTWSALYASSNRLRALTGLGRLDEARATLARHRLASSATRFPAFVFMSHAFDMILALAAGDFAAAEASAERAYAIGEEGHTAFGAGVFGLQLFAIRRAQGRLGEVLPVMKMLAAHDAPIVIWRPGLAVLYAELGMLDDARRELAILAPDRFAAVARDAVWPACLAFLAEAAIAVDDRPSAAVLHDELQAFGGRNLMVAMTVCLGPADRLLGGLARVLGRLDEADRCFADALALATRSGSPVWEAEVRHDWARLLAERGDARTAEMGRQARAMATALGMDGLAGRPPPVPVRAARPDLPLAPAPLPDRLSTRELEVLRLVASGLSNRDIGARLYISQNTVANHVRSILQKSGTANRAEAVAYVGRHGLLSG